MNDAQHPQTQADYHIAKAAAACVQQHSLELAQHSFREHHADIQLAHAANYERAKANFEQYKTDEGSPHLANVTRDWDIAKRTVPDFRACHREMDRATRAIDARYHQTMRELAEKHGIGAKQQPWRAE